MGERHEEPLFFQKRSRRSTIGHPHHIPFEHVGSSTQLCTERHLEEPESLWLNRVSDTA
jgi:hypothetical protein